MVKAGGYANHVAFIDLTERRVEYDEVCEEDARKYIGGRGLGVKYVYDINPKADPFSPENPHALMVGPLTGSLVPLSGRLASVTRSPLTGTITDSHVGGYVGAALKWAGFDGIVMTGISDKPVYLLVKDGVVKIEDATSLWGRGTLEVTKLLKSKYGEEAKVFAIGPAGERKVRFASIIHDGGRASGRGGTGAVMGSKRVKAVVVVGYEKNMPKPARPDVFEKGRGLALKRILESSITAPRKGGLSVYGTDVLMNIVNEIGALPTRNGKSTSFEHAYNISGENLKATILISTPTCHACPVACKRESEVKTGKYAHKSEGPEYETSWALGANIGLGDIQAVSYLNYLANDIGVDTIELGNVLGVAAEASERGLIDEKIAWGDADKFVELVHLIARREGIGEILAEGSARAAKAFGDPDMANAVKGQGIPAYDPRGLTGFSIAYATSNRGACHLRSYTPAAELFGIPEKHDPLAIKGKPELVKLLEDFFALTDSLDVCKFSTFAMTLEDYATMLTGFTGWDIDVNEVLRIGERIWNLERYINQMNGFDRRHDILPKRFMTQPSDSGPSKGNIITPALFNSLLDEYYRLRGWNSDGTIPFSKLRELQVL
ncbi:MAG: aldehyde ferredoxin oxidoreductase family protein [Thermoprotei archaeon]